MNKIAIQLYLFLILFTTFSNAVNVPKYNTLMGYKLLENGQNIAENGNFFNAIEYFEKALLIFRESNDNIGISRSLGGLGICYRNVGKFEEAKNIYKESLLIDKKLKSDQYLAYDYIGLGMVHEELFEWDSSLNYYNLAHQIAIRYKDSNGIAKCYNAISNLYLRIGNITDAINYANRCQELYIKTSDLNGLSTSHMLLGNIYFCLGDYDYSEEYYRTALLESKQAYKLDGQAIAYYNIGNVLYSKKDYINAKSNLYKSAEIFTSIKYSPQSIIMIGQRLFDIAVEENDSQFINIMSNSLNNPLQLARYYFTNSKYILAETEYSKSLQIFEPQQIWEAILPSYIGRGFSRLYKNNNIEAANDFYNAIQLIEIISQQNPETIRSLNLRLSGYSLHEAYEGMLITYIRNKDKENAFKMAENTKARNILKRYSYNTSNNIDKIPLKIKIKQIELKYKIDNIKRSIGYNNIGNNIENRKLDSLTSLYDNLVNELYTKYYDYAINNISMIRNVDKLNMLENEVIFEYEITRDATYIFVIENASIKDIIEVKISRDSLTNLVNNYLEPIRNAEENPDLIDSCTHRMNYEIGYNLYNLLLNQLKIQDKYYSNKTIIIIPDEILCSLPFEMLITQIDKKKIEDMKFIADKYAFSYWQSATFMSYARSHRKMIHNEKSLLIGDPIYNRDDNRYSICKNKSSIAISLLMKYFIPPQMHIHLQKIDFDKIPRSKETEIIIKNINNVLNKNTQVLMGNDANETKLKSMNLKKYGKLILFALHGIMKPNMALLKNGALILTNPICYCGNETDDGYLTYQEISNLDISTDLVATFACKSGVGEMIYGEGLLAISNAFQIAGARSVLSTMWKIQSESAIYFSNYFINEIKLGKSKNVALFNARKKLRMMSGFDNPYYWAPYILLGENQNNVKISKVICNKALYYFLIIIIMLTVSYLSYIITQRIKRKSARMAK